MSEKSLGLTHLGTMNEDKDEIQGRPQSLDEFQGQDALKKNLSIFIQASRQRAEALDHVFLSGPPGLGKTTLAGVMAAELGVDFKATSAPALDKPKDLVGILTSLKTRAVFFIDEIHRLKPAIEEMLYIAMEDYQIDWIIGQGVSARNVRFPLAPFTLIGATTKPGKVSSPLYTRFGITQRIELYNNEELSFVLERSARLLGLPMAKEAIELLASCSRGTPRVANRLLRRVRDFAFLKSVKIVEKSLVSEALQHLRIDHCGLEEQDRSILRSLIENYHGGPVGVDTLAISVGETADSLEDFYEPFLIQQGFLERTARGRKATILAYEHMKIPYNKEIHANSRLLF